MSLREFLKEERQNRKAMREERKKSKKAPKTKREKVYRIVSILFILFVIFGSSYYACSRIGGGLNPTGVNGLTEEMLTELKTTTNESLVFGTNAKINDSDRTSLKQKLSLAGVDLEAETLSNATSNFTLNAREVGALSKDLCAELVSDNRLQIEYLQIYNVGSDLFEKSIAIVDLSKYLNNSNLPIVYFISVSKVEVLDKKLVALNYATTINTIDKTKSESIISILNTNAITTNFTKICNDTINLSLNMFAPLINCDMFLNSGNIEFIIK